MQPMRSHVMEWRGLLFFSCGWGEGEFCFFKLCLVWRMGCLLFTFHLDSGRLTFHVNFFSFCLFVCGRGIKAKSYQVPDMFPKEFSIAPHFYPICLANVVLLSRTYLGQRGGPAHFKIEPSILWSLCSFFVFWVMGQSNVTNMRDYMWWPGQEELTVRVYTVHLDL
jgi:hypothetical protein